MTRNIEGGRERCCYLLISRSAVAPQDYHRVKSLKYFYRPLYKGLHLLLDAHPHPPSMQVETLDRRTFTNRALVLKQLVLCVYRLIVVLLMAAVLLAAHLVAGFASWQVGPNAFQAS